MVMIPTWIAVAESKPPSDIVVLREREEIVEAARMLPYDDEAGMYNELTWLVFNGEDAVYEEARVTDMWRMLPPGSWARECYRCG